MRFATCPRVKQYTEGAGEYVFSALKVFTVGEGDLFARALKIFLPDLKIAETSYEEANVRLTVSTVFSAYNEYCGIRITPRGLEIRCRDNAGARNAAAILKQLVRRTEAGYSLPLGDIADWPDAQYRACMLESSGRVWMDMDTLRSRIYEMAQCRMNVLIFHFMEAPGCTVPLASAPHLHGVGPENRKFTRQEVDDMIAYAADLGIRVTPFVEILSHAADFAITEGLMCPGDKEENLFDVCLGQEKTFEAIERVIRELTEIFPDDVIHIGADEYDVSRVLPLTAYWDKCPHCRALSEKMGFTTLRDVFLYGIERINGIVNKVGKVMMLWNADLQPGHLPETLDRNMIVHYYRYCSDLGRETLYNLNINGYAEDGFSVINSYYPQTYMDQPQYMTSEKMNSWTHLNGPLVKKTNWARVPGGCMCAWEEFEHYKRTVPAAIALVSDRLWNAEGDPVDYDDAYGAAMTRVIFDGRLPEGMNIFVGIGDVLGPLKNGVPANILRVEADMDTLSDIRDALLVLSDDHTAQAYAEAIDWVMTEKQKDPGYTGPRKDPVKFEG